ncbi:TPA: helix-turn-helix domain containing protein [Klebsiella pneumoniae]|nr:helix-turn-helix domain containing protein [Klebsiella pneumoniae]HBV2223297.1 helix-turn-helix domain containing protein [Klebsiella pneumoniae]HBW6202746.1 helix-turn-helix domain containing protein [Klebsiella pneumoniae]HBW6683228.1 helix-turn-helix domain containing protein [Klebsiella pneumoniae]
MSDKELSRINVIQSVVEKRMRRRDAAHQLALTERQTQRLMNRFRESGAAGLANLRRGRPGNHRLPESLKLRVLSLLHDNYSDFGPTLAAEKLRERHNITVSVETLRKWMTADGLWVPYSRRRPRVHQPRYRRDCLGELVQIDDKMDELDREGKRDRSKKMPKRRAQARVQEQLRAINPVLANPEEFRASLKR